MGSKSFSLPFFRVSENSFYRGLGVKLNQVFFILFLVIATTTPASLNPLLCEAFKHKKVCSGRERGDTLSVNHCVNAVNAFHIQILFCC